jgi:hypothetical protein
MSSVTNSTRPWARGNLLSKLVDDSQTPQQAFTDPKLSKLGDALLNFLYSLILSASAGAPEGRKVPNSVLAKAIDMSRHRGLIPRRSDKHGKGDIVEAIFAYAWLRRALDLREGAESISRRIRREGGRPDSEIHAIALAELMDRILDDMGIPEDA